VCTDGDLGHGDLDGSKAYSPVIPGWSDSVEHNVTDEIAKHQSETADKPLCSGEVATTRTTTHREPDVLVIDAAATSIHQCQCQCQCQSNIYIAPIIEGPSIHRLSTD